MPSESVRELAREEPEAFLSVVEKAPEGRLKETLRDVYREETEGDG